MVEVLVVLVVVLCPPPCHMVHHHWQVLRDAFAPICDVPRGLVLASAGFITEASTSESTGAGGSGAACDLDLARWVAVHPQLSRNGGTGGDIISERQYLVVR